MLQVQVLNLESGFLKIYKLFPDVDIEVLTSCPTITTLNLEKNPLTRECHDALESLTSINVKLTPKEIEEWEDLTI